jgi:poly [ADP-ribose] polymerase
MDYEAEEARRFGGINRWHHLECFVKLRQDLGFLAAASTLSGFTNLKAEDITKLNNLLPIIAPKTTT